MNKSLTTCIIGISLFIAVRPVSAKQWTLKNCIDYALSNNISLQKTRLQKQSVVEDIRQSQAALLPSLSFSTSQNVTYRPWPQTGISSQGYVQSSVDKVYYNGSYGINGNWTIWNGGRNTNTIKLNKLAEQQATMDSATASKQLIEQITQLYVQILYSNEAITVNKASLETSKKNEERGQSMLNVGKMSKADLAQLSAQRAQDEYNIVQTESNLKNYKRQLKQLLQITNDDEFEVIMDKSITDDMALQDIPSVGMVYDAALSSRPEIQNAQLGIQSSDINIKIAKALRMPTISLSAGVGTSTTSMNDLKWGTQLKNNFDISGGVTVSIPLFDQRQAKTSVNKAIIQKQTYILDLKDKQTTLYSTIENYWLQANNNQSQFRTARVSTESAQTSYDLLNEQFRLGLKNIVELMKGKDQLLTAKQNELQSKYLAILNINMLKFYKNGNLD